MRRVANRPLAHTRLCCTAEEDLRKNGVLVTASAALRAVVEDLDTYKRSLASEVVAQLVEHIVDYRTLPDLVLTADVQSVTEANIGLFTEALAGATVGSGGEWVRRGAARRLHQGVSLEALLRSYRMWGSALWQYIAGTAGFEKLAREESIQIAGLLMEQVNQLSDEASRAYREEAVRPLLSPDVLSTATLEHLFLGRAAGGPTSSGSRDQVQLDRLWFDKLFVLGVGTSPDVPDEAKRNALDEIRTVLGVVSPGTLFGLWSDLLIAICPAQSGEQLEEIVVACEQLAEARTDWLCSLSKPLESLSQLPSAYSEIAQCHVVTQQRGWSGRLVRFSDVILGQVLQTSPYAHALLAETIDLILAGDAERGHELLASLRAYVGAVYNVTAAARLLHVNPNTLTYRLRKIEKLTGRRLHDSSDLVLMTLGLQLYDLENSELYKVKNVQAFPPGF